MQPNAATIQRLIDQAAERQRQADRVMQARRAGDEETARFYERPPDQRQRLLAQQDIADASAAARAGDEAGTTAHIRSAIERQMGGARLHPRRRLPG